MYRHKVEFKDGKAIIDVECFMCKKKYVLYANENNYKAWMQGTHIQNAMPELNSGQRELLISGTCNDCWEEMFS